MWLRIFEVLQWLLVDFPCFLSAVITQNTKKDDVDDKMWVLVTRNLLLVVINSFGNFSKRMGMCWRAVCLWELLDFLFFSAP